MARVFLLTSDPGASGATSALVSAVRHIAPGRHQFSGLDLGSPSQLELPSIRFNSILNLNAWRSVRSAIRAFAPDVIHLVGDHAVRLAAGLGRKQRLLYSGIQAGEIGLLGKRALCGRGTAIVHSQCEARAFPESATRIIPYGVSSPALSARSPVDQLPAEARVILFGGSLDPASHPMQAAWAFDVLKYTDPRLYLVFAGDGPLKSNVQQLALSLGFDDYRVHFANAVEELPYWKSRADLLWLTQAEGGAMPALEALAYGLPVIAMRTPELAEYAGDLDGLVLVPPGDRVSLASATKKLLEHPRREIPMPRFSLGSMVEGFSTQYDALAGGSE